MIGWSFEKVIGGLVAWVLDGVSWVVGAVFGFIDSSTSPTVTAPWFVGNGPGRGPYGVMLSIAASLLLLFVFAGLIQGVVAGDTAGMARGLHGLGLPLAFGFDLVTWVSSAIVNVFVPSGGGQWAVQGGIVAHAAQELGVPTGRAVMDLAYGDQWGNMLQPFWALPLLGITGLRARDIMGYTVAIMLLAAPVFALVFLRM